MKRIVIFITILLFLCFDSFIFGQLGTSIQIGASVGNAKYSGSDAFTKDLGNGGMGISSSIRYGAKARLSLPLLPINFVAYYYYAPLNSNAALGTLGKLEYSSSLSNIGIGVELPLLPGPIKPYLAADYLITKFGDATFIQTFTNGLSPIERDSKGSSRSGVAFGAGLRFTLLPIIDIDGTIKYNMNNLFGKESGEDNIISITAMVTISVSL